MLDCVLVCYFVKQKSAYEMLISDWSSDVCSSDLLTIYPMMNVLGVTDLVLVNAMRISPQDATFLSQDPHRLNGRKLGAFAGFLKRCAREHDPPCGRLDGQERLIALVVTQAAFRAGLAQGTAEKGR